MARTATKKNTKKSTTAKKPESSSNGRKARKMNFTFPPESSVKPPRENCKRAKVLEMLQSPKGATHEEVMKTIGWDRITAYEGIRLLNKHNGYGLREDENGRIHAYERSSSRKKADA